VLDVFEMRRLAFLDLDLTLFDYTAAREGATTFALQAMGAVRNVTPAIAMMNSLLVPYGDSLVDLGLPNLRREWKAPELFAIFAAIGSPEQTNSKATRPERFLDEIATAPSLDPSIGPSFRRRRHNLRLLQEAATATQMDIFIREIGDMIQSDKQRHKIDAAVSAFNEYLHTEVAPNEGVFELFESLNAHGFEAFIVSEGDEQIQKEKISILNLAGYVEGAYISSSCCQSERLLGWLWSHSASLEERDTLTRAIELLYDEALQFANKTPSFFRKVLHTVLLPRSSRRQFYCQFEWLSEIDCLDQGAIHVLLFGDRYEKDLYPGLEAFRQAVTIRLLSGKYGGTYQSSFLIRSGLPIPGATVSSVSEAAAYINNLGSLDGQLTSSILAPPADSSRIQALELALDVIRLSIDNIPLWVINQVEELVLALHGSEIKTNG
jgi:FMN phosphatase YigB (HAD superfamily)